MPKKFKNAVETDFRANDRMTRTLGVMSRGMQRLNRMAGRMKAGLTAAGRAGVYLGRNAMRIAKVGLFAVTGAATAVFLSVTKLAGGMDDLAKTTRAIDFDIEKFQEFRFAAEQSGVGSEKFTKSLTKFTKTVGEAKGGYGAMFTALKKTNPQLLKQLRNTNNASDAFELYLKAIRETPGAMNKAALATAGFGREGVAMINMANLSEDALNDLRMQMRQNGVVTAEQAAKAESFNDAMNRMKLTAKGLAIDALSPLMPLFEKGADRLRSWIIENRELIKQKIHMVFENIVKFGRKAFIFLSENIPRLIEKIRSIGEQGFAWIKENEDDLRSFGEMLKSFGKILLSVAKFVIKNKEAVLSLVVALGAMKIALAAANFSGFISGAGAATGAVGTLSSAVGKGGMLVAALAAGWAVGSVIVEKWINGMDRIALSAENTAAKLSMGLGKAKDKELGDRMAQLKKQEKQLGDKWSWKSVRAVLSGDIQDVTSARIANKKAQEAVLMEQLKRLQEGNAAVNEVNKLGYIAGRQSGGVGETPSLNPLENAPMAQSSKTETITREHVELVIKDETGRSEISKKSNAKGLTLIRTGAM